MTSALSDEPRGYLPVINLTLADDGIRLEAFVAATSAATVTTMMSIEQTSPSGVISTSQSSEHLVGPEEPVRVALTHLSFTPDTNLKVTLIVRREGTIVARAQTFAGSTPEGDEPEDTE
ncbi:MAG: curli-like amyloid fiber formation chaperone CsgH [Paracoccaceae bacterium]